MFLGGFNYLEVLGLVAGIAYIGHLYEDNQPSRLAGQRYELMEGTYWTTSKANTVLPIKTMFLLDHTTGSVKYLKAGEWQYSY